jgi:hypothetical protein
MGDYPPTEQDIAVKNELSGKINEQLELFGALVDDQINAFNKDFNARDLKYLFVED